MGKSATLFSRPNQHNDTPDPEHPGTLVVLKAAINMGKNDMFKLFEGDKSGG